MCVCGGGGEVGVCVGGGGARAFVCLREKASRGGGTRACAVHRRKCYGNKPTNKRKLKIVCVYVCVCVCVCVCWGGGRVSFLDIFGSQAHQYITTARCTCYSIRVTTFWNVCDFYKLPLVQ